jgi:hypothetical protein
MTRSGRQIGVGRRGFGVYTKMGGRRGMIQTARRIRGKSSTVSGATQKYMNQTALRNSFANSYNMRPTRRKDSARLRGTKYGVSHGRLHRTVVGNLNSKLFHGLKFNTYRQAAAQVGRRLHGKQRRDSHGRFA